MTVTRTATVADMVAHPGSGRFDALLFDAGGVVVMPDPRAIGDSLGLVTSVPEGHRAHYHALFTLEQRALEEGGALTVEHLDWNVYRAAYAAALGFPDPEAAIARMSRIWSCLLYTSPSPRD